LVILHAAVELDNLRIPPGNRLETLKGNRKGQHSIRINDQWRLCFLWQNSGAYNAEIIVEKAVGCARVCAARRVQQGGTTTRAFARQADQRGWAGRAGRHRVHSVVSQEVIASYAQQLNLHAVCQRTASGQLLFLGTSTITR
jgi:hypothetical protein